MYTEMKQKLTANMKDSLEYSQKKDPTNPVDSRFRGLEQDVWSCRTSSYQGLVMQQVGKSFLRLYALIYYPYEHHGF